MSTNTASGVTETILPSTVSPPDRWVCSNSDRISPKDESGAGTSGESIGLDWDIEENRDAEKPRFFYCVTYAVDRLEWRSVPPDWRRYVRLQDLVWLLLFAAIAVFGPGGSPLVST